MSGFIFFGILGVWFFVAKKLTDFFTSGIEPQSKKNKLYPLKFIFVFIVPVMDEIIGGFQFRALCTPKNLLVYDAEEMRGKTLQQRFGPDYYINGKMLPIKVTESQWFDPTTKVVLLTRNIFYAKGGWLLRITGWSANSFNGSCDLISQSSRIMKELNVTRIE
jgi:hypothetical protein